MKKCFKCGLEKDLSAFYPHKQMKDGHLNKCKSCTKIDEKERRSSPVYRERILAYDRARGNRQTMEDVRRYRDSFPKKYKAHSIVNNAIRSKKLFRMPCEVCGILDRIHAHHDDYDKPLNVRWLCAAHHLQWHAKNGEGLNAK